MEYGAEIPYLGDTERVLVVSDHGETLEIEPPIPGDHPEGVLKLSKIRKVSPRGTFLQNRGWIPTVPNSFGLPPGETCPGKTDFCESCYAFGSIRSKGVKEALDDNLQLLRALETEENMSAYLCEMLQRYDDSATHHKVAEDDRVFRIHWSGDFYSEEYTRAWAYAIRQFPHITFWAYTRSFRQPVDVVPILDGIENLTLFLSTDSGNINDIPEHYSHQRRANSALDVVSAVKLARPEHKAITCPENLDRLKLMQDGEGACIKCRLCFKVPLKEAVDINFITSGKHDASPRSRFATEVSEQPIRIGAAALQPVRRERYITFTPPTD